MLHTILINDTHINYWESGDPKGTPVILVHGLGGDHRGLVDCTAILQEYRLIIPDLPGYGLSELLKGVHTLQTYATFLNTFREQLQLGQIVLIGHSFGAAIALTYASLHPKHLRKLVLLNPVVGAPQTLSGKLGDLYMNTVCLFPERVAHWLVCNKLAVYVTDRAVMTPEGKSHRKRILQEDYMNYRRASLRAMREGLASLGRTTVANLTPSSHIDTAVIAGSKDTMITIDGSKTLADALKAQFVAIEGGHLMPLEDPDTIGQLLDHAIR